MADKKIKKKLVLLDAHAILHRAYHALPDFSSSKGEPTGALYGLSTMLIKIINELKPDHIIACFDLPEPTYRHEAYEEYKSGRKKAEDDLVSQLKKSYDVFGAFGIPALSRSGFEADDILGTLVEKLKNRKDLDIVIASGDMDTLQLVDNEKVKVYTLKKGIKETVVYNEEAVVERFGFTPDLLPDYKGLRGDPSDNIIGIAGIGDKTASTLIQKFGSVEEIYKKLKKDPKAFEEAGIKPRIIKLLEENEEEAVFSKMLATIRRDVPLEVSIPDKTWEESLDINKINHLFTELDFRTLGQRVKDILDKGSVEIQEPSQSKKEKEKTRQSSFLLSTDRDESGEENISEEEIEKVALALWILNSSITNPGLDDVLAFTHSDERSSSRTKTKSFTKAKELILKELKNNNLQKIYEDIELPLMPVIGKMNKRGIKIDTKYLSKLSKEYHKKLEIIEKAIWKYAGEEFNINSPKQIREILFEKMNLSLKNHKKTGTGVKSTKESELEKMRELHPIIEEILRHRELQKLLSTYIDNIPKMLKEDGRLHAKFLQTGTTTGRMSSQEPNLQNIPIKSELGRNIRNGFVAERGFKLVALDYSQIELRVAAFMSGDKKLVEVFKKGGDVHNAVASEVFEVPPEKVDSEMRRKAKVINFGILYGMGVNALRVNLGTDRAEAQKFLNEYFKKFEGLASYLDKVKRETERKGFTETFFGRKRYFEGIKSRIPYIKAQAERMAINAPLQGTSADIIKLAMVEVHEYLKKEKLEDEAYLLLQVHDELVYEIKENKVSEVSEKIRKIMEEVLSPKETGGVPLIVKAEAGDNWGEMREIGGE